MAKQLRVPLHACGAHWSRYLLRMRGGPSLKALLGVLLLDTVIS